jgi:CRP-like cAMP-binding protein
MNKIKEKRTKAAPVMQESPLVNFLRTMFPISDEVAGFLQENTTFKKIPKGKFLLKPGEICSHYYFIHTGVIRAFVTFGNKDITTWINAEHQITTSIRGLSRSEPSHEYLQTLENCELVILHYDKMKELYQRFPETNTIARIILESYYGDAEQRSFICRIPNAEKRYRLFVASRPELLNRIPLKHIASFLCMTVETLSRLRSKKNI